MGKRAHRLWFAALVAAVFLGGCMGSTPASEPGDAAEGGPGLSQEIVATATKATTSDETGGIEGSVLNDVGARLKAAHIVLIGTPHSARTDSRGEFAMSEVKPGDHTIRVDAENYRPLEQVVTVVAASVTRVNITLVPLVDSGAGYRDHLHDLWGDATQETLFEGNVHLRYSTACGRVQGVISVNSGAACSSITIPLETIVKPGTERLEVVAKWRSDFVPQVRFDYQPANFSAFIAGPILKPGDVGAVAVRPPMHDGGHAKLSMWTMRLWVEPQIVPGFVWLNQNDFNDRAVGPFEVRIVAFKGEVHAEPAHERFWANGSRLVLVQDEVRTINSFPRTRDPTVTTCGATSICWMVSKGIVPPGSTRMEVTLTYGADAPYNAAWEPLAKRKSLIFRPSDVLPRTATFDAFRFDKASSNERGKIVYELKLEPEDIDAFYQKRSNWLFLLGNEGAERETTYVDDCPGYIGGCPGVKYKLLVEVINDDWTPELAGP